ncbi:3-beta-glucanase) [Durusdinium trenchii]
MSWTDSRREVLYHDETPRLRQVLKCRRQIFGFGLGTSVLLALVLLYQSINTDETARVRDRPISYGLPGHLAGVNLGGWLCLEDWFYSGDRGLHVSTVSEHGQGRCLPPAVSNTPWDSEGNLTFQLNQTRGYNFTVKAFSAHRHAFIGEEDLSAIASLGLQMVRLPLTWAAFADALMPLDQKIYGSHNPMTETTIVPDPFYKDQAAFATIPRDWLAEFLVRCAKHGLRVLIDLHAFPGGSSQGTYNGVWPNWPAFWRNKTQIGDAELSQVGLWIIGAAVGWLEHLSDEAKEGLVGITLMNEPAHLNSQEQFAAEEDILRWLAEAAQVFRVSSLPKQGKKLYVQMIDTAFKNFTGTVVPWFFRTFSELERLSWVVADQHWYTAWSTDCDMRADESGSLNCDAPMETIRPKLYKCASSFAETFQNQFGMQMAVSEFSVGTSEDALFACRDRKVLMAFLQEQLSAWDAFGIQGFFWTWRMPFGKIFEPGWSLRWLAGLEETANLPCFQ